MKDCYETLGLARGLSREEYLEKYNSLKAEYSENMFLAGEPGNAAAMALTDLESAWMMILSDLDKKQLSEQFGDGYGQVDALVREGNYDDAQTLLDKLMTRDAEWHYYQSLIFYKREWMNECRRHIVIALQMEPDNQKYKQTLEMLDLKMANPTIAPEQLGEYQFNPERNRSGLCGNGLSDCCLIYCLSSCCIDCCCSFA